MMLWHTYSYCGVFYDMEINWFNFSFASTNFNIFACLLDIDDDDDAGAETYRHG